MSCGCLQRELVSSRKTQDMGGVKFGLLTVISKTEKRQPGNGSVVWKCFCRCGNITDVIGASLRSGATTSCGCVRDRRVSETHRHDLSGMRFGRLTVVERCGTVGKGTTLWNCTCDCGRAMVGRSDGLSSGRIQSCGCRRLIDYHGYRFRSKWELYWYVASIYRGKSVEYEPVALTVYVDKPRKYIPDFQYVGTNQFVEVKGRNSEKTMMKYVTAVKQGYLVELVQRDVLEAWCGCSLRKLDKAYSLHGLFAVELMLFDCICS